MRTYELVVVLRPNLGEADRKKLLDQIKGWLGDVKVMKEDDWGSKALKYPIKKELTGYYFDLTLEGETLPEGLERRLLQQDEVLRHLLLRK